MLGEFFAARLDEIDGELVDDGPWRRYETVEAKGLSEVSLATLGEIFGLGAYDDLVDRFVDVPKGESNEAGVLTIPPEFRDALAGDVGLDEVAQRWCETEELSLDGWQKDEALLVVREVRNLARTATRDDRDLWYWWSL